MKILLLLSIILLVACATTPQIGYGERVLVISGHYRGHRGILIGDCPGFENYLVRFPYDQACISIWNLEKQK